jgi:RNA polymerase primary sigma factor
MRAPDREKIGRLFLLALSSGSTAAVRAFLARGINLDARDASGRTALMITASRGHLECSRHLLEAGSDPLSVDDTGLTASDHAIRGGSCEVAELVASFVRKPVDEMGASPPDPEPPPFAAPGEAGESAVHQTNEIVERGHVEFKEAGAPSEPARRAPREVTAEESEREVQRDQLELDWEEDQPPVTPEQDVAALASAEALQGDLSRFHGEADGVSWNDLLISLPESAKARSWALPPPVRRRVLRAIRSTLDLGAVVRPAPGADASGLATGGIEVLIAVAGDAGLRTFETDPWWDSLSCGPTDCAVNGAELLEEFEQRLAVRRSPSAFDAEVARIPSLDRHHEETLWSAIDQATDAALMEVSKSAEALECILKADRLVRSGRLPFSFVSNLDVPNEEHSGDELPDGEEADDIEESETGSRALPKAYIDGMAEIEALSSVGTVDALSVNSRRCANDLRQCSVTIEFVAWVGMQIERSGKIDTAIAVDRLAAKVNRVRAQITNHHMPHVLRFAERYSGKGLDRDDLVQEGSIGLLRAVQLYDRSRGHRFWTYAIWWVRQAMSRALQDKCRLVRLPVHVGEQLNKIERARELAEQELGKPATYEVLSQATGVPVPIVRRLLRAAQPMESLELATAEETYDSPWEIDPDRITDPFQVAAGDDARDVVSRMLLTLDPREERILRLRFGIGLTTDLTLEEVGQQFGVTRERIRQIEAKALARLGHPARSRALRSLTDE